MSLRPLSLIGGIALLLTTAAPPSGAQQRGVPSHGNLEGTDHSHKGAAPHAPAVRPAEQRLPPARTPGYDTPSSRSSQSDAKETLIAANLSIEGKIQGSGHVRVAGQFKGDVNVEGNLTIEQGAKVIGGVRASTVTIAGELEGNVDAASRVELLASGVLNGDLKAGSLTVAAGSRMRGNAEFGWEDGQGKPARAKMESGSAA